MAEQPLIAVLDYGIGNLRSAQKALERCGADARLTADRGLIADADAVVLPGVGAFGACMDALRERRPRGRRRTTPSTSGRPFLGICVGMQMLFDGSEEDAVARRPRRHPRHHPLARPRPAAAADAVEPAAARRRPRRPDVRRARRRARGCTSCTRCTACPTIRRSVAATCEYGGTVNAAFRRGNVFATQFHPEKSGDVGPRPARQLRPRRGRRAGDG